MDLVYVLGNGSKWANREIRYSLRSVEAHLKDAGRVIVVGVNPGFFSKEVIHIHYPDMYGKMNADGNMIAKVLKAIDTVTDLSDNFIYMNDDGYFLCDILSNDIPYFHKGQAKSFKEAYWKRNFPWRARLKKTMAALEEKGHTTLHFDHHNPVVFNKHTFKKTMSTFRYSHGIGLCIKSLYCNVNIKNATFRTNEKARVDRQMSKEEIEQEMVGKICFSHDDKGLNRNLKSWIKKRWPEMSKYESLPDSNAIAPIRHKRLATK